MHFLKLVQYSVPSSGMDKKNLLFMRLFFYQFR